MERRKTKQRRTIKDKINSKNSSNQFNNNKHNKTKVLKKRTKKKKKNKILTIKKKEMKINSTIKRIIIRNCRRQKARKI